MIKHIIKIIFNERKANAWIFLELLIVSFCMWFLVDKLYTSYVFYNQPTDLNIENVYRAKWSIVDSCSSEYNTSDEMRQKSVRLQLMGLKDIISRYKGVEAVTLSYFGAPYTGSNIGAKYEWDSLIFSFAESRLVSEEYPLVYRMKGKSSTSEELSQMLKENKLIISNKLSNKFFGDEPVIGARLTCEGHEALLGDVLESSRYEETKEMGYIVYLLLGDIDSWAMTSSFSLEFRVRDNEVDGFMERFREDMGQMRYGNLFVSDISSLIDVRDLYQRNQTVDRKMRYGVIAFLLVNVFLGIIGTFWYRTEQRKREMGLRMAIGSTRNHLRYILFSEGLLILSLSYILTLILSANFYFFKINLAGVDSEIFIARFFIVHAIVFALMAIMIVLGIYMPSKTTTKLNPAEVLHAE